MHHPIDWITHTTAFVAHIEKGARCSSVVRAFAHVCHDWCNKGRGVCYPVSGMMHIKEPLLLIGKSSLCSGSRFPLSYLSGPLTPYNRK